MIKADQIENKPKIIDAGSAPVITTGQGSFYPKAVLGVAEAFYIDDQGREIQITSNGAVNGGGGGSGEANTASNLGTISNGSGLFSTKVGVDLQFKRVKAGTNITLTEETNDILISATGGTGEVNTASNLGTAGDGEGVFSSKSGVDLRFRRIKAGTNIVLTSEANDILISASGGASGEANTASNLGVTGEGLYAQKVGVDLQFKKIIAGTNVTISSDTNSVTINASGGGSVSEYSFTLAAGSTMADRIAGASDVPSGWTLAAADTAGEAQFGSSADTLVISHALTKIAIDISVLELSAAGPSSTLGYTKVDLTSQGAQKTNTTKSKAAVIGLQPLTTSTRALVVFVKLI